jgi:prepilin-type N-terminal cleavage/methylation domain-containing protein
MISGKREMDKRGFTLAELMVSIIILAIFILSVGMILTSSWRFWNDGWEQVRVQQDASYAFARIEKIVRGGSSATVLDGGSGLQVIADGTIYIYQTNGNVLQLVTGGNTEAVTNGVQSINFSSSGDTVSVTLTLLNGSSSTDFRTTILLRNSL